MRLLPSLLLLLIAVPLCAQDTPSPVWYDRFIFDIGIDYSYPVGQFADRQEGLRIGFQSAFYVSLGNRPIYLGAGYRQMRYSSERIDYSEIIDGEAVPFNIRTSNNSQGARLIARLQPRVDFPLQPFAEGILEGTWWYTRTVIEDEELDENVESTRNASDFSPSYGAAAGAAFFFNEETTGVYLKASYLRGNTAEYFVYRDAVINPVDPIDYFEPITGPTDRWLVSLGVVVLIY